MYLLFEIDSFSMETMDTCYRIRIIHVHGHMIQFRISAKWNHWMNYYKLLKPVPFSICVHNFVDFGHCVLIKFFAPHTSSLHWLFAIHNNNNSLSCKLNENCQPTEHGEWRWEKIARSAQRSRDLWMMVIYYYLNTRNPSISKRKHHIESNI